LNRKQKEGEKRSEKMTDAQREESESGKFSIWVHVKNWISDYLKTTDIDIDGNKYVSTNVKNLPADYPDATAQAHLSNILTETYTILRRTDLNINGANNLGINVQNEPIVKVIGSTDGGSTWVPLKVNADGKVICVST